MYTKNRETEVIFLKRLWTGVETVCPKCHKGKLAQLHKKGKSNDDWKCPVCGEIYRTINMLKELPEK